LKGVGAGTGGPKALSMFDIGNPDLDWVKLAEGMGVEACRTDTIAGFAAAFHSAMTQKGPRLIEAVI
jgi:acetolactate synthase-1/2/3 large subunit